MKVYKDIANSSKYKEGIFYHATGGCCECGVGQGLYLGKDKVALDNFYNCEDSGGYIEIYQGYPNFIDLALLEDYNNFENKAIAKFGKDAYHNYLMKMTLELGYDGIRYYDPSTTGEEFVLYNTDKVKLISKKNRKRTEIQL